MSQGIIELLSDPSCADDDGIEFVGSKWANPASPVFMRRASKPAAPQPPPPAPTDVIDLLDDDDDDDDVVFHDDPPVHFVSSGSFRALPQRSLSPFMPRSGLSPGPSFGPPSTTAEPLFLSPGTSIGPGSSFSRPRIVSPGPSIPPTRTRVLSPRHSASQVASASSRAPAAGVSAEAARKGKQKAVQSTRSLLDIINDPSLYDAPPSPVAEEEESLTEGRKKKKHRSGENKENADAPPKFAEQLEKERAAAAAKEEKEKAAAAAKEAKKVARQSERDTAKAAKEAEKSYQKKLNEVNRLRTSKVDALRDIELHMSHDLSLPSSPIAGAMPELQRRVDASASSIIFVPEEDTVVEGTIRFLRRVRAEWDASVKQFIPLEEERDEWEPTTVLVATADAIVDRVSQGEDALVDWMSDMRLTLNIQESAQLILVVKGMDKYHGKTKSLANRAFRDTARAGLAGARVAATTSASTMMARVDKEQVEAELLRAQVMLRLFVVHVDKTDELEDWLFNLAGDVAVRPHKLQSKNHLPFSAPEHARKAQEPGEALELMLQEVQGVTASAAYGMSEAYGSFRELMAAYEDAEVRGGTEDAEEMLAECEVRSLKNGMASSRRVGKALSRKVYNLMRGTDPLSLT